MFISPFLFLKKRSTRYKRDNKFVFLVKINKNFSLRLLLTTFLFALSSFILIHFILPYCVYIFAFPLSIPLISRFLSLFLIFSIFFILVPQNFYLLFPSLRSSSFIFFPFTHLFFVLFIKILIYPFLPFIYILYPYYVFLLNYVFLLILIPAILDCLVFQPISLQKRI